MNTDILLIKPDFLDIATMPPLGLGYLVSVLKNKGFTAHVHDNTLLHYTDAELSQLVRQLSPRIVGISAATPLIDRGIEIAALVKQIDKNILTVFGGPHPSAAAEETLQHEVVDVIVVGEGEETVPELVSAYLAGSRDFSALPGCACRTKNGQIVYGPARKKIVDLDTIPFPFLESMPIERYFRTGNTYGILQKKVRSIPIIASRGCPSKCTFCQRFLGYTFRIRSAENIVEELMQRMKTYNINEFNFLDDNFTLHKRRVIETCEMIHRKGLAIKFRFPNGVREDYLDEEILEALQSVGCYHLDFGIESGTQKVLDLMKKGKTIEKIAEKVVLCKQKGFKVSATFLFGLPGETLSDMHETIRFATSLPLDSASFSIIVPYPGTELRSEVMQKGYLVHNDYTYYNPALEDFRPPIETPDWTAADLLNMQARAFKAFFLRPRQMLRLAPSMMNPANVYKSVRTLFMIAKRML